MGPETGRRRLGRREVGKVWQPVGRTEQWWEGQNSGGKETGSALVRTRAFRVSREPSVEEAVR